MNNLIEIQVNENQEQTISGRELHMFLGVDTKYNDWIQRMLQYGFEDGQDFNLLKKEQVQIEGKREVRREIADHIMKLDMAKELCMLTRNEKGKQARHYFLEVERDWNSPEKVMARALVIANKQIDTLKLENTVQRQVIAESKPIKEYVDTILSSEDTVPITQIAADYGLSAKALNKILNEQGLIRKVGGQWVLYSNHMQKGYTKSETIDVTRSDGSIKVVMNTKWTQKGRLKIHELLTLLGLKANMDKTAAQTERSLKMDVYTVEDVMRILCCKKSYAYKKIREARDMLKSQGYILPPAGKVPKAYFNERVYKKESVV